MVGCIQGRISELLVEVPPDAGPWGFGSKPGTHQVHHGLVLPCSRSQLVQLKPVVGFNPFIRNGNEAFSEIGIPPISVLGHYKIECFCLKSLDGSDGLGPGFPRFIFTVSYGHINDMFFLDGGVLPHRCIFPFCEQGLVTYSVPCRILHDKIRIGLVFVQFVISPAKRNTR